MGSLIFNYIDNCKYSYSPKFGILYRVDMGEDGHLFYVPIFELPIITQNHLLSLMDIARNSAIGLLQDILIIYNKGIDTGKRNKQEEIKRALGIE